MGLTIDSSLVSGSGSLVEAHVSLELNGSTLSERVLPLWHSRS